MTTKYKIEINDLNEWQLAGILKIIGIEIKKIDRILENLPKGKLSYTVKKDIIIRRSEEE